MAAPQAESSVLATPPPPNRLKQRGPPETVLASPFTTFLKHLPDLTPPRATTYNSYSSFAFTVQSPAPARLASSHQTPAKSRSGDQDQDGAPFANILALADLKATPVKAEPDQDGLGYRGNNSETPYGLRSPIPLFHQSPRRPGISGSPTPGSKLTGGPASELRGSALPAGMGSPNLISSAFAALLEGHSRSSPGGTLSMLGAPGSSAAGAGAGPGSASRSFSGLFSPVKATPAGAGGGSGSERGSGSGEEGSGGGAASGSAGAAEQSRGTAAAAAAAAGAASGEQRPGLSEGDGPAGEPSRGGGVSSGGEGTAGGGGGAGSSRGGMPPLPPFFSPPLGSGGVTPGGAGSGVLHRGGSFRSVSGHGGASTADDTAGESGSDVEGARMGEDDAADDDDDYTEEGRRSRARRAARRSMPPAESPRMVRQRPGSAGLGQAGGSYGRLPAGRYGAGASRRAAGSSADSLANADFATDDDAEPTPLVHAMLPQSPMCVPLNLDTFLPIPKLRSDDRAGSAGTGSPTHRTIGIRPAPIDSPAVKAATNAAITAALEAAVGPASSSGASGSMRSTRGRGGDGDRGAAGAARAAAAAAAAGGTAPLTRRQSSSASARNKASFLPPPATDEALLARMKLQSNKKCSCKKSKCLKLYCDCFAGGGFCGPHCSCAGCSNRQDNLEVVKAAREQIASRNPNAFKEKIEADPSLGGQHRRGCNCKKSHCMKKYCECFSAGVPCGEHCKCDGCHNGPDQFKRQPPSGRGRRGAAAATAGAAAAVPPLPPVAAAMRAGAIPILIPTATAAQRGMQMAAGAAGAAAGGGAAAATAGEAGLASDAAATLALGSALGGSLNGALQFLLPMAQQQQQQQAGAAAAAAGDESGTPRAAQGDAAATPSPSIAPPAASSPQVLQIFSMMQPPASAPAGAGAASSAAAGVGAQAMPASSSQFLVPLMWPFANGAAGQQLPLSLPSEVQGDPAAAMKLLQQMTAAQQLPAASEQQQQQQRQGSPVPFPNLAPTPATAAAAAVSSPTALAASEQGEGSPLAASSPALALADSLQPPLGGGPGAAVGTQGGPAPASPSFSFQLQPGSEAAGGGASPQPLLPPHPPAAAAAALAPVTTNGTGPAATPAALADMDVVLDSPRGEAVAVTAAAAAAPGSWLQLNAIGGSGVQQPQQQQQQQGAGAAGEGPAAGAFSSHAVPVPAAAMQQETQGPPTRKRTRGASRAGANSGDSQLAHLQQQQQQQQAGGGLVQHAPPASPRATPTKRKPLRTITSALM